MCCVGKTDSESQISTNVRFTLLSRHCSAPFLAFLFKRLDKCSNVTACNKDCRKTQLQGFNILCTYSYKASTFPKLFHSTNLHHKRRVRSLTQLKSLWNISSWPLICHVTGLGSYVFIFYVSPLICSKYVCLWSNHHFCLVRKYPCSIQRSQDSLTKDSLDLY